MDIVELKKVKFTHRKLTLYYPSSIDEDYREIEITYVRDGKLKEQVIEMINAFVDEYSYAFNLYCSKCGNCCRREDIYVKGGELYNLGSILDLNEKKFYEKYLTPCASISEYDGFIKLPV